MVKQYICDKILKKVVQKELLQKLVSVVWLVIDELGTSLIEPFLVEPLSLPNTLLSLHALFVEGR
jgi:hypothetical protein